MQSMDQVYSLSNFPVGLLSVRTESEAHMGLLIELLRGDFVKGEKQTPSPELKQGISLAKVSEVLQLLELITSDPWWTRA